MHNSGKLVGVYAHLVRILPFDHNPAQGFRPRIAQKHTPAAFKTFLNTRDGIGNFRVLLERQLVLDVDVPKFLRIGDKQAGKFRKGTPALAHDPQDLERGKEAVAGGAVFTENKMTGLLSTEQSPVLTHGRHNMAIAHIGADKRAAPFLHEYFKRHIAHDSGHKDIARKFALLHEILCTQSHDLVTIQNSALLIHDNESVGIAVQRKADVGPGFADLCGHGLRVPQR